MMTGSVGDNRKVGAFPEEPAAVIAAGGRLSVEDTKSRRQ